MKYLAWVLLFLLLNGCSVGFNTDSREDLQKVRLEIERLNGNLESMKKDSSKLTESLNRIANQIEILNKLLIPEPH